MSMKTAKEYVDIINNEIAAINAAKREPESLYAPIVYAMEGGGKRIRPMLALAVADALGGDCTKYVHAALAVEGFHNFTLLHDDIMDRADTRHGRPSVYRKYGEAAAILSGDAMLTLAGMLLTDNPQFDAETKVRLNDTFNARAMEVYFGQAFDMDFESRNDVTIEEYNQMIGYKTAALIAGSCQIGAICAGANEDVTKAFFSYGDNLGMAFQLQDDLLDTFGDPKTFGKPVGGDILNDKKTWLRITAQAEAPEEMGNATLLSGNNKIETVRNIYLKLNLPERCDTLINQYTANAIKSLDNIGINAEARQFFVDFANSLIHRAK